VKTVGNQRRGEIEPDASEAWRRGAALDAMLRAALPVRGRGAWRLTHSQMNQLDFLRQLDQAAKVNARPT
jgi:hypothetical protein